MYFTILVQECVATNNNCPANHDIYCHYGHYKLTHYSIWQANNKNIYQPNQQKLRQEKIMTNLLFLFAIFIVVRKVKQKKNFPWMNQ